MCGRFDTSRFEWREIHDQLSGFGRPVTSPPVNLQPNDDVRPTTDQITARLDEDGAWVVEKMRWGLVPFWRNGKPLKDTSKGAGDGFKLTTFNCRVEGCENLFDVQRRLRQTSVRRARVSLVRMDGT